MNKYKSPDPFKEGFTNHTQMGTASEKPSSVFDMIMKEVDNPAANDPISKEYNDLINGFRLSLQYKADCVVKMLTVVHLKKAICDMLDAEINRLTEEAKIHEGVIGQTANDLKARFEEHGQYIQDENKVIK